MLPELLELEERRKHQSKGNIFKRVFNWIKNTILNFDYIGLCLVAFCLLLFVVVHEETHGQVFKEYGCTDITYGFDFEGFYTDATCNNLSTQEIYDLKKIQTLTEVIQYPMGIIIALLTMLIIYTKKTS